MKFHWGWGIAIFYTLFVLVFMIILFFSFGQDNSLVEKDYYQQDITYQTHIDKRRNYESLGAKVTHQYDPAAATLTLVFPEDMTRVSGECFFYRPSSERQDYRVPLKLDETRSQVIPVNRLISGQWTLKLEWEADGQSYYMEDQLLVSGR
jgi:nitrogen fixation protein FixH